MLALKGRRKVAMLALVIPMIAVSACNSSGGGNAAPLPAANAVMPANTSGAPYVTPFDWGTFKLSDRIVKKVQQKQPLNFVYTISDAGQPVFSPAVQSGFTEGVSKAAQAVGYPIQAKMIGPVGQNINKQISEVRALFQSNQIDVLVFNAAQPGPFVDLINQLMDAGVPVWGTGGDSPQSKRIGFFALDEQAAGKIAGQMAGQQAKAKGITVKKAALFTGDPAGPWAQSRMQGFVEGLTAEFPGVQFVNSPSNPINATFDYPTIYTNAKAFIIGHPDVQMLFSTDDGVTMLAKAIADTQNTGKMISAGFNISQQILDSIKAGTIAVTVGQNWHGQASEAASAAADFIFKGTVIKGFHPTTPYPVTSDTLAAAQKVLASGGA
jgi:ABC-type sugar transport system substrate-binding protein